jgi:hypothetical protein
MAPVTGYGNGEGEAMMCSYFWRGRGGGGEAAPRCRRQTTHRRVAQRSGRLKVVNSEKIWLRV